VAKAKVVAAVAEVVAVVVEAVMAWVVRHQLKKKRTCNRRKKLKKLKKKKKKKEKKKKKWTWTRVRRLHVWKCSEHGLGSTTEWRVRGGG
jgi:hypothetical protein